MAVAVTNATVEANSGGDLAAITTMTVRTGAVSRSGGRGMTTIIQAGGASRSVGDGVMTTMTGRVGGASHSGGRGMTTTIQAGGARGKAVHAMAIVKKVVAVGNAA